MSDILIFARKWNTWYRVLRHRKAFSFADSVHYGLWLARGCAEPAREGRIWEPLMQIRRVFLR